MPRETPIAVAGRQPGGVSRKTAMKVEALREALTFEGLHDPNHGDGGAIAVREKVYQQIRFGIICGNLRPGTILTLRATAEALATSVMPVREAFHILTKTGALRNLNNKSFSIAQMTVAEFIEVRDIRLVLECMAVRIAVEYIDPGSIELLRYYQKQIERYSKEQKVEYLVNNYHFHFTIYRASRMGALVKLIETLWLQTAPNWSYYTSKEIRKKGNEVHQKIIESLAARDVTKAEAAIAEDINSAAGYLIDILKPR